MFGEGIDGWGNRDRIFTVGGLSLQTKSANNFQAHSWHTLKRKEKVIVLLDWT